MCSNICMFIIYTYLHYGERKNGDFSTPKFGGDLLYGAMIHQDEWELHHLLYRWYNNQAIVLCGIIKFVVL